MLSLSYATGGNEGLWARISETDSMKTDCLTAIFSSLLSLTIMDEPFFFKKKSVSPQGVLDRSTVSPCPRQLGCPGQQRWAQASGKGRAGEAQAGGGGKGGEGKRAAHDLACTADSGSVTSMTNRFTHCLNTDRFKEPQSTDRKQNTPRWVRRH